MVPQHRRHGSNTFFVATPRFAWTCAYFQCCICLSNNLSCASCLTRCIQVVFLLNEIAFRYPVYFHNHYRDSCLPSKHHILMQSSTVFGSTSNLESLSDNNHGSAATVTTVAASTFQQQDLAQSHVMQPHARETAAPFSVAENRGTQSRMRTPSATRVTRVAAESLGTLGIEYSMTSGRPRQIHGPRRDATSSPAASDLGFGLSDDSLLMSPDEPASRRPGIGATPEPGQAPASAWRSRHLRVAFWDATSGRHRQLPWNGTRRASEARRARRRTGCRSWNAR